MSFFLERSPRQPASDTPQSKSSTVFSCSQQTLLNCLSWPFRRDGGCTNPKEQEQIPQFGETRWRKRTGWSWGYIWALLRAPAPTVMLSPGSSGRGHEWHHPREICIHTYWAGYTTWCPGTMTEMHWSCPTWNLLSGRRKTNPGTPGRHCLIPTSWLKEKKEMGACSSVCSMTTGSQLFANSTRGPELWILAMETPPRGCHACCRGGI